MRRTLAASFVALAVAGVMSGLAAPASAVCGGGEPGDPCHCPSTEVKVGDKVIVPNYIYC